MDLHTTHGLVLKGCYLKARSPAQGRDPFGLEFGSNRWACLPYCDFLRDEGYDIFTFETRGQGESPAQPGYEPLQWVTEFEIEDFRTAIRLFQGPARRGPARHRLFRHQQGRQRGAGRRR